MAIEEIFNDVKWEVLPPETDDEREREFQKTGIPYSTHSGVMHLLGVDANVHRLNTGQTVIEADGFKKILEAMGI